MPVLILARDATQVIILISRTLGIPVLMTVKMIILRIQLFRTMEKEMKPSCLLLPANTVNPPHNTTQPAKYVTGDA